MLLQLCVAGRVACELEVASGHMWRLNKMACMQPNGLSAERNVHSMAQ